MKRYIFGISGKDITNVSISYTNEEDNDMKNTIDKLKKEFEEIKTNSIKKLFNDGYTPDNISYITGISIDRVREYIIDILKRDVGFDTKEPDWAKTRMDIIDEYIKENTEDISELREAIWDNEELIAKNQEAIKELEKMLNDKLNWFKIKEQLIIKDFKDELDKLKAKEKADHDTDVNARRLRYNDIMKGINDVNDKIGNETTIRGDSITRLDAGMDILSTKVNCNGAQIKAIKARIEALERRMKNEED